MITALLIIAASGDKVADPLAAAFRTPPLSARPHTWWHWMNGNVTKEGITADLEAMRQVGIGGAQMFTVDQDIPAGSAKYAGPEWRALTAFAVKEAARLGLELCLHNCAGWSSSGGPWVKPEDAMQVLAWSSVQVKGPTTLVKVLPPIAAPAIDSAVPYARDIAVYAYRTPAGGDVVTPRPADFLPKTGVVRGDGLQVDLKPLAQNVTVKSADVVMLTEKLDASGKLTWQVPAGDWTILRMGHVPTGVHNHPAPPEGDGLEVDKLSREAFDRHWDALVGKVLSDIGPGGTKTLNNVLIDSYEVGNQNWTPKFREQFRRLRGYDPLPYLPVVAGRIIDSKEVSERFLWDLRRTIADLFAENYFGRAAELAHQHGMNFSTEPYGSGGFDTIQSGGKADIPMGEFWLGGAAMETTKLAASVAHIYGRKVVGAESFTADVNPGRWREEPYAMKALGDLAFCNGINRYIFHRYAMQPWLNFKPGMTMGPWGTHLERTQTWWTEAATWLQYVARCQYLLQSGKFKADVCYYYGENSPADIPSRGALKPTIPDGFDYDGCDAETLMKMSVRDGKVVLPEGMEYRVLVLPDTTFMTPSVIKKVRELVLAGATVVGPKPTQSPSLADYPRCDAQVQTVANQLWGETAAKGAVDRIVGKGRVLANVPLEKALASGPDFDYTPKVYGNKFAYIHRQIEGAEVYFVSNQRNRSAQATFNFRVGGQVPELWHPETGAIEEAPAYRSGEGSTTLSLRFDPAESVFVVFRKKAPALHLASLEGTDPKQASAPKVTISVESARYGSEDGRGADVTDRVRSMVKRGEIEIPASNSLFGDPVVSVVKRLTIQYRVNGKPMSQTVNENESLFLGPQTPGQVSAAPYSVRSMSSGEVEITSWKTVNFVATPTAGPRQELRMSNPFVPIPLDGPWQVSFPPNLGAPASVEFPKLASWTESADDGVKYFSGSASYRKSFTVPKEYVAKGNAIRLNLGEVKNFVTVRVNGKEVAVLWKPPFSLDVSAYVHAGVNDLEVKVTNLWPNRIIGDEQLPPDAEWEGMRLKRFPDWLVQGKPRPKTGRITFSTYHYYDKNSPLLESGLLGPVTIEAAKKVVLSFK
jgi:alpha-L-rhamnosidase/Glycosyl hydrolases family 2, sugar binding domain